uniref:Shroom family member 1 n=1 Tax=Athene cunicularia TaxID=194338 RepID=A0A663MRD0_ATHCN
KPMSSLENGNCLSPVKSISSVEHLLHLPGRADSAYSSFSGGSNVPEYPTPSCYGENCCLPPEQVPYMDSEYVRGIYNVSAANSDPRGLHPYRAPELSIPNNSESTGLAEQTTPIADDLPLEAEDLILGSPASSTDESFKNDYREKLKVAQKKVLRETSFKRKDLQMSLPVRLRQKPSKRPSIEHLRSFSLSSASRIGGRKRVTKEQKKLCYSEPEKLDQRRTLENRGRALSSSSISRTELKQIQQTALIEYMERKINQRPGSSQHLPLQKPPLQKRLSHPKWPPGKISNPNGSRKLQNNEVFCQVFSEEKLPDQLAASPEEVTHCHTASAQPCHGAKNTAKALVAKETSVHNSQEDILPKRERDPPKRRLQSPEDQRYEALAMEIVAKDNSLVDILMPHPVRKTALDLMEGLFPVNISVLDKSHRKKGDAQRLSVFFFFSPLQLELISSLRAKLQSLWEERELVLSEARECAERGKELEATVRDVCKPNEFERYMMFIGDLEKVVSLLLCLSSRLARVQNAMRRIDGNTDAEEKQSLNERHKLLSRQREDAKDLKENLDRRERVVSGILAKYLSDQRLQDYRRFVQVKTSLLIEQKDLEEQIKFFEEQLENLEKSTGWTCPPLPWTGQPTAAHSL